MIRVPARASVAETVVDRPTGRTWTVDVDAFEIAATVVTIGQWNTLLGIETDSNQADFPKIEVSWRQAVLACNQMSLRDGFIPTYTITSIDPPNEGRNTWSPHYEPAPDDWCVTWDQEASGYRLPTDAEWQVACRAGSTGPRYGDLDEIAWYADNSHGFLHPVAEKKPNAWGLFDTLGGVWEWCWDQYDAEVYGSYRVIRGGGWSDPHWGCRVGVRRKTNPQATFDDLGFRLARTISADDSTA